MERSRILSGVQKQPIGSARHWLVGVIVLVWAEATLLQRLADVVAQLSSADLLGLHHRVLLTLFAQPLRKIRSLYHAGHLLLNVSGAQVGLVRHHRVQERLRVVHVGLAAEPAVREAVQLIEVLRDKVQMVLLFSIIRLLHLICTSHNILRGFFCILVQLKVASIEFV